MEVVNHSMETYPTSDITEKREMKSQNCKMLSNRMPNQYNETLRWKALKLNYVYMKYALKGTFVEGQCESVRNS